MGFIEISPWDFNTHPFSFVGKQKMLLSASDAHATNVMTVAWGGFGVMWGTPCAFFVIRPSRYTYTLAEAGEHFALMSLSAGYDGALSYCGTHSGREGDKVAAAGLTPLTLPSGVLAVSEAEIVFDLKKLYSHPIVPTEFWTCEAPERWYDKGDFHKLYFAEVKKIYHKE